MTGIIIVTTTYLINEERMAQLEVEMAEATYLNTFLQYASSTRMGLLRLS